MLDWWWLIACPSFFFARIFTCGASKSSLKAIKRGIYSYRVAEAKSAASKNHKNHFLQLGTTAKCRVECLTSTRNAPRICLIKEPNDTKTELGKSSDFYFRCELRGKCRVAVARCIIHQICHQFHSNPTQSGLEFTACCCHPSRLACQPTISAQFLTPSLSPFAFQLKFKWCRH
jgi:hypothetical protein